MSEVTPHQELVVPKRLWGEIRDDLLATPELERAAIGYAGLAVAGAKTRLLLRDWSAVPQHEYLVQLSNHLEVSPAFWARAAKRARDSGEALVILHSHPRDQGVPRFSPSDDFGEDRLVPKIWARASVPVGAVVLSPGGEQGRMTSCGLSRRSMSVRAIGSAPACVGTSAPTRFDRQVRALGNAGQGLLREMTVGVVGAGGLGSHVVQQLLHLGIGQIVVVEPDCVTETNLSRLVGATRWDSVLKRPKVKVAQRLARRLGRRPSVLAVKKSVTYHDGVAPLMDCDVIFGCTDNQWSRTVLNSIAYQYYIPVMDLGVELQVGGAMGGRLVWLEPGSPCLWCLGILDPERVRVEQLPEATRRASTERGYIHGLDEPAPAVVSVNGVIASLGVTELLARITGFAGDSPRANVLMYRLTDGVVRRSGATSRQACPTCSSAGVVGTGQIGAPPWSR